MLTESMRLLAGIQESETRTNPIPQLIKEEQEKIISAEERIKNEKKTVISHFDIFKEQMIKYQEMIEMVNDIFAENKSKEFVNGLFENKYPSIQKFADIVINESLGNSMEYLDKNYYNIKEEIDKINYLNEELDESKCQTYFVANLLKSKDIHNIKFNVFKNKDLTEKVSDEIEYGVQIFSIKEDISMIKINGTKYYTTLTKNQLEMLENKGFLI